MQIDADARVPRTPHVRAWLRLAQQFATTLGGARHDVGGLLLVGTAEHEPWHFAAHLSDAAHYTSRPELAPTLVRHHVPPNVPAHLAVDLSRLSAVGRNETVLVSAPAAPDSGVLERLDDARRRGALLLALDGGPSELDDLAHESLAVPALSLVGQPAGLAAAGDFDLAEHLLTVAARRDAGSRRRLRPGWLSFG